MSAQQLAALAGVVAATNAVTRMEAARIAQQQVEQEQARRNLEVDKDRRHQLDLLNLQNDVNKAALKSQAELGAGVAQAGAQVRYHQAPTVCPNGHPVGPNDHFCARCGAAIQT
ncbi:hypothetical protein LP420_01850 [Massilia sp. B-10]|nr:hypothetical protein LP420_01850 [Massilia sp. B-10]